MQLLLRRPHPPERQPRGTDQPGPRRLLPLIALPLAWLPCPAVQAQASLALCQQWQRSSGLQRIQLGNSIGAAAYLTKVQRLAESDPEHPVLLYSPADLQRTCQAWR